MPELRKPMKQQASAIAFAEPHRSFGCFMEMRLGKCMVAIRWAVAKGCEKVLVIAPLSALPGWRDELDAENQTSFLLSAKQRKISILAERLPGWALINYEALLYRPQILDNKWDAVIADESDMIKNPQTQITKLICDRTENVPIKACLSGTPNPESPLDFFMQFKFLRGEFLGCETYWQFRHRFFHRYGFDWVPHAGSLARIKAEASKFCFFMTRAQAHIGSKKIREYRSVDLAPAFRKIYRDVEDKFELSEFKQTKWRVVVESWLGRLAGGFHPETQDSPHKVNELLRLLRGEIKNEKIVVWFRFNREIRKVASILRKKGFQLSTITGATQIEERHRRIQGLRAGRIQILLAQVACAKYGVDVSAADIAIYFSNSYSGKTRRQSEDRIVHPFKKRPLLYIDLVTKATVDEDILSVLRMKKANSKVFFMAIKEGISRRQAS